MVLPKFTDLRGIASDLSDTAQFPKLDKAIRQAAVAQSCVADLAQAQTCCEALDALLASPRKKGTMERAATEHALLMNTVLLYARATATVGQRGERGSIGISAKLAPDQLKDHDAIVEVRNRALAHVYSQEVVADGIWHDDRLFAVETQYGWQPAAMTKRYQFNRPFFERLRRQIPIAHALVKKRFLDRIDQLTEQLNLSDASREMFERHLFDPIKLFGSIEGVMRALAARSGGPPMGLTSG